MTDTDENLLTMAKAGEVSRGDLEGRALEPAGVLDGKDLHAATFVHQAVPAFEDTELGKETATTFETEALSEAIDRGDASLAASLVGITEQELDASGITVTARLLERLDADGTLTTCLAAGRPNTGKTNTVFLLAADLAQTLWDDLLVISNCPTWDGDDITVTSMHDLMTTLVEHKDKPKTVTIDEASRYMDARTFSHEVSTQFTPAVKAMSKLGVEALFCIGHTGKDVVPAAKRLTNLALWKTAPDEACFYEKWAGDSDRPSEPLFDADLVNLEPTLTNYDPDDVAPWSWDLDSEVFDGFRDWDHFASRLNELGPA